MWMNRTDIEIAAENCAGDPVLGPATRFLKSLMEAVDSQSDGWSHWSAPSKAAKPLMDLIGNNTGGFYYPSSVVLDDLDDVKATITPIKRMVTLESKRQKERYGNTFEFDVDAANTEYVKGRNPALKLAKKSGGVPT